MNSIAWSGKFLNNGWAYMLYYISVNHRGIALLSLTLRQFFFTNKNAPIWIGNCVEKE